MQRILGSRTIQYLRNTKTFCYRRTSCPQVANFSSTQSVTNKEQKPKVLITGCLGQIGSELMEAMREEFGNENVIGTDVKTPPMDMLKQGPFEFLDTLDESRLDHIIQKNEVNWLIHNAAFLSAVAEKNIKQALRLNCEGLHNVLSVSEKYKLRLFVPSSIAAFGASTPLDYTPNLTIQRPTSVYGIGKVYAELMGEYYCLKRGVDFRSIRYPGIISYKTLPGGGTTDYAVDIFYYALSGIEYPCYLKPDARLPMMYMPDCIRATISLMKATPEQLSKTPHGGRVYNVSAVDITPQELANTITKYIPSFRINYDNIDPLRQSLATSWTSSMDDTQARKDWGWKEAFRLDDIVKDMIIQLSKKVTPKVEIKL